MAGDNKTQVLIELQLEMKKLKGQMKEFIGFLKDSQKQIKEMSKANAESSKEYLKSLKEIDSAHQKSAQAATRAEKQKQDAVKKTGKELAEQEKKIGKMAQAWGKVKKSGPGQFGGGFMAGAGLSGLTQKVTAKGAGSTLGRGVSAGVGGVANFFMSGVSAAYQQFMQYGQALGGLVGLGTPGQMKGGLKGAGGVGGARLGYGPTATAQQARGIGRATGNIGQVYRAQQFSRAYGMDVGEAGGYMGTLRQAGFGFGGEVRGPDGKMQATGRQGSRELTKIIEAGMISGLEKGRIGEFLQGVSSITSQLGSQLPGKINVSGIAAQAAMLGQSKLPGFQGARGMQLLARLNQSIQRPGGGEAGQAMMMQALGFGKPGGGTSYYKALKMQERGIDDPRNLPKLMKEVYSQLGDSSRGGRAMVNEEANLAMKEITGLSLKQVEELQDIMASGKSAEEQQKEIKELMKKAEPIEKQALKTMKQGFGGVVSHIAGVEAMQVAIGAKMAPMFMNLQKLQLKMLSAMVDFLPKIWATLKDIYLDLRGLAETLLKQFGGGQIYEDYAKNLRERLGKTDPYYKGSLSERIQAAEDKKKEYLKGIPGIAASLTKDIGISAHGFGALAGPAQLGKWQEMGRQAREQQSRNISGATQMGHAAHALRRVRAGVGDVSKEQMGHVLKHPAVRAAMEGKGSLTDLDAAIRKINKRFGRTGKVVEGNIDPSMASPAAQAILRKRGQGLDVTLIAKRRNARPAGSATKVVGGKQD